MGSCGRKNSLVMMGLRVSLLVNIDGPVMKGLWVFLVVNVDGIGMRELWTMSVVGGLDIRDFGQIDCFLLLDL